MMRTETGFSASIILKTFPWNLEMIYKQLKYKNMDETGITATLITPYKEYRNIELIRRVGYKWLVRICGSGLEIEVYEDEFVLD
jgi:hypothetical protein